MPPLGDLIKVVSALALKFLSKIVLLITPKVGCEATLDSPK